MENNDVEETVPAAEDQGLEVSQAAAVEENESENGGGGADEHEGAMVAVESGGGDDEHEGTMVAAESGGGDGEFTAKRKRGRPRKQLAGELVAVADQFPASPPKRGRGRPRGSGKKQLTMETGSNFTPRIIAIQEGENIVEKIWSISQATSESICILSASGTISIAEIFVPASRGGVIRHQGQFAIVYLNGSHTYDLKRGAKICLLSVQLSDPNGRLYGGAVAGSLIASSPTQLVIATFRQNLRQEHFLCSPMPNSNIGTLATPMLIENGKVSDGDQRVDEVAQNGSNAMSQSSSVLPIDWKSLQPDI